MPRLLLLRMLSADNMKVECNDLFLSMPRFIIDCYCGMSEQDELLVSTDTPSLPVSSLKNGVARDTI